MGRSGAIAHPELKALYLSDSDRPQRVQPLAKVEVDSTPIPHS
ncbi:MAG: hypothetical protein ACM37W_16840 [Actinomycetota bacterium]